MIRRYSDNWTTAPRRVVRAAVERKPLDPKALAGHKPAQKADTASGWRVCTTHLSHPDGAVELCLGVLQSRGTGEQRAWICPACKGLPKAEVFCRGCLRVHARNVDCTPFQVGQS